MENYYENFDSNSGEFFDEELPDLMFADETSFYESDDDYVNPEDTSTDSVLNEYSKSVEDELYSRNSHIIKSQFMDYSLNAYRILAGDLAYRKKILLFMLKDDKNINKHVFFPKKSFTAVHTRDQDIWFNAKLPRIKDMELINDIVVPDFQYTGAISQETVSVLLQTEWYKRFYQYMYKLIDKSPRTKNFIYTLVSSPAKKGEVTHYMAVIIDKSTKTVVVFDPSKGIWDVGAMVILAVQEFSRSVSWNSIAVVPRNKWQLNCVDIWCQTWSLFFQFQVLNLFFSGKMNQNAFLETIFTIVTDQTSNHDIKEAFIRLIKKSLKSSDIQKAIRYQYKQSILTNPGYLNDLEGYKYYSKELNEYISKSDYDYDKLNDIKSILKDLKPFDVTIQRINILLDLDHIYAFVGR